MAYGHHSGRLANHAGVCPAATPADLEHAHDPGPDARIGRYLSCKDRIPIIIGIVIDPVKNCSAGWVADPFHRPGGVFQEKSEGAWRNSVDKTFTPLGEQPLNYEPISFNYFDQKKGKQGRKCPVQ